MNLREIQTIFAEIQGSSDAVQLKVASAMYAIERMRRDDEHIAGDLLLVRRMINEALPKFNWGDSCLDADAIGLLNSAPAALERVLTTLGINTEGN